MKTRSKSCDKDQTVRNSFRKRPGDERPKMNAGKLPFELKE